MEGKLRLAAFALTVMLAAPLVVHGAAITEIDSTQPRGAPSGVTNADGQDLSPIIEGFRAPARFSGFQNHYDNWVGSMMANAIRDPRSGLLRHAEHRQPGFDRFRQFTGGRSRCAQ
jgi:hypothetical protein